MEEPASRGLLRPARENKSRLQAGNRGSKGPPSERQEDEEGRVCESPQAGGFYISWVPIP